jgi:hypothetical protein
MITITSKGYDEWKALAGDGLELAGDAVAAMRAVVDYTTDILTVVRTVATVTGVATRVALAEGEGSVVWHTERAVAGMVPLVTGGTAESDVTPTMLGEWLNLAHRDRDRFLEVLADEFGWLLYVANMVSAHDSIWSVTSDVEGRPYWHVQRAHIAVLTLLTGSEDDGERLHELWAGNQADTAHNRKVLAEEKRANSVIVTVAADGNTATVVLPGGLDCEAGRVGDDSGLFWVADEMGDVIGHSPAWLGVGELLAKHYGYPPEAVELEYAETEPTGVATPVEDTSEKG